MFFIIKLFVYLIITAALCYLLAYIRIMIELMRGYSLEQKMTEEEKKSYWKHLDDPWKEKP